MLASFDFWISVAMIVAGLAALAWSSDRFIAASSTLAKALGISPFIIGMVIVGFGTSAPELCVSVMSGISGHADLSIGNAYGSCIFNIAVILGVSAWVSPLTVKRQTAVVAGVALTAITVFSFFLLRDGQCSRFDSLLMLGLFSLLLPVYCWYDQKNSSPGAESGSEADGSAGLPMAFFWLVIGFSVLVGSSHILVKGSVNVAKMFGVSDLMIGLTIVAAGTSLPELASAIASARRREHELVLGNIIGSNFFNMLAVVGLANVISPSRGISGTVMARDLPLMALLSFSITLFGINFRRPSADGAIGRGKGLLWLAVYVVYTAVMYFQEVA
jgi:cation:H+ antiporter